MSMGTRQLASYAVSDSVTALCLLPYETASGGELILLDRDGKEKDICFRRKYHGQRFYFRKYGSCSGRRKSQRIFHIGTVP